MSDNEDNASAKLAKLSQSASLHNVIPQDSPNYCFEPHKLCALCSRITLKSKVLEFIAQGIEPVEALVEVRQHHKNEIGLKRSISDGCHLCALLYMQAGAVFSQYEQISDNGLPDGQLHLYISTIGNVKIDHPRGHQRFHFEFGLGKPNSKDGRVRPHEPLLLARELPDLEIPNDSFFTASTGSDAAFELAKKWLTLCLEHHHCCSRQGEFPVYLPNRLLEITGDPLGPCIKLIETGGYQRSEVQYLTLSHCWGSHVPLRLQKDNYPSFLESIDFNELPQLFKNAVQITRRLGFKYLWIDAMCIIQDHDIDWDEALRMSEVFGNSVCTLSALAATDSTEACIYDRLPLGFVPCRLQTASGTTLEVVSWRARELLRYEGPNWSKAPLHSRAWVMQERYLTPRQIHFSRNQLWWQCCEATFTEVEQIGRESLPFLRSELRRTHRPPHVTKRPIFVKDAFWKGQYTRRGVDDKMDWHTAYWNLITDWYTPGKLSRIEDRWPAVSGIAKMIEVVTGVRQIAGLWTSHLMFDMLWNLRPGRPGCCIDNGQPSWSWLSVDGPVYQEPVKWTDGIPHDKRFTAEILELPELVPLPMETNIPYFSLPFKPLSMLIRAPMMKFPDIPEGVRLDGHFDTRWQELKTSYSLSEVVAQCLLQGYTCWNPDYVIAQEDLSDAWVLQWTRQQDYSRLHKNYRIDHQLGVAGLIVKPLDSEHSRWRRIGKWGVVYDSRKGKPIGELKTIRLY